jgi:hypothetical protein
MSQRGVIVSKVVELLQAEAGQGHVHRYAMRPIEQDKLPAYVPYVTSVKCTDEGQPWGMREYDMDLRIEARAIGKEVDAVLDPMISLIQAVMLREPFLDGTAFHVKEGEVQYDALDRDKCYCAAACDYTVRFYEDSTTQGAEPLEPNPYGANLQIVDFRETTS